MDTLVHLSWFTIASLLGLSFQWATGIGLDDDRTRVLTLAVFWLAVSVARSVRHGQRARRPR
jgi:hypothetical protein